MSALLANLPDRGSLHGGSTAVCSTSYAMHCCHKPCTAARSTVRTERYFSSRYRSRSDLCSRHQSSPSLTRNLTRRLAGQQQQHAELGSSGSSSSSSSAAEDEQGGQQQQQLTAAEVDDRLRKVVALISTAEQLAPYDPGNFNVALLIWRKVSAIPEEHRGRLLRELSSADIKRLWRLTAKRMLASRDEQRGAMAGQPMWADLPGEPGQVVEFDGKAALPIHTLGISSFRKAFFISPGDYRLYGRVLLRYGPLGDALYPLYYRAMPRQIAIPATGEVADMALDYLPPEELGLGRADIPVSSWPMPSRQLYPFNGGLSDYVRPVGPGVYVGVGWRAPRPGLDLGRRFLHFLLVKRPRAARQMK